ncbi:MAG: hypothetical protein A3G95_00745 [Flavobacteria bacterium RIFCSPLOWO2_12_FULL_31_7]|jgi:hypothetical protein|nr:MAG: hypothetical protein A3G95_00745 [Flavobacteria bacterium RIFCSPLOWO2_12_FULL_31_7]
MNTIFKSIKRSREIYASYIENYTLEQLNTIPDGLRNNLIWNIAHIIVSQQRLAYLLSGNETLISEEFTNKYVNGTIPDGNATQEEVDEIKQLLFSTIEQTILDYENGKFDNYTETQTRTGFLLTNIEEAMLFNHYHEGIHLGFMMKIKRFI